jgi:TnpA family transposase
VIIIPQELEAAMSMQAQAGRQAEREKSARVTYGESEVLVAKQVEEASKVCTLTTTRWRTHIGSRTCCIYESMIKVQGNTIVVMIPSESLNSMGFGNLGMTLCGVSGERKKGGCEDNNECQGRQCLK